MALHLKEGISGILEKKKIFLVIGISHKVYILKIYHQKVLPIPFNYIPLVMN